MPETPLQRSTLVRLLGVVAALAVVVRAWLLSRPVEMWDGRVMPDDAWLYLELSRGIAEHGRPVFEGAVTNGFHPMFAFVLAGLFKALDPNLATVAGLDSMVFASQCVGAVADLGCFALIVAHVHRRFGDHPAVPLAALLWAVHPAALASSMNGMETTLALFFFLLVWWFYESLEISRDGWRSLVRFGALVGLALLARLDLALLGALYAFDSFREGRSTGFRRSWWTGNLKVGAGFALVYGPWAVYSLATMGRVFPDSGKAVRLVASNATGHQLTAELFGITFGGIAKQLLSTAPVLAIIGVVVAWAAFRNDRLSELRWLRVPAFLAGAIFFAYGLVIWSFFRRYGYPSIGLFLPLVITGAAVFGSHVRLRIWTVAGLLLVGVIWAVHPFSSQLVGPSDEDVGYRNMAIWARDRLPKDSVVGAPQCGALAYYSDRPVVNLDGVVSREAYEAVRTRTLHERMSRNDVDIVIGREFDIEWVRSHSEGFDEEWERMGVAPVARGWSWEVWRRASD